MKACDEQECDKWMGNGRASLAQDELMTVKPDMTADKTVSKVTIKDMSMRGNQVGLSCQQTKFPVVVVKPLSKVQNIFTKIL